MQSSPGTVAEKTDHPQTHQHDWDVSGWVPDKPSACDYGYVTQRSAIGCSREELVKQFATRGLPAIKFVWTPDSPQPVLPEKVPLMLPAFRKLRQKAALTNLYWGVGLVAFGVLLAVGLDDWTLLYRNFFSIIGGVLLVEAGWGLIRSGHYTLEDAAADASSLRFDAWIKNKRIKGYAFGLAALIVVVGAFQVFAGPDESINRAGLVKAAVWQGELWRMGTATLMHASWMHFWMNFLALLYFSRIIEQTIHRAYVPFVFLLSGAAGSIFSVLLYPNITSVGASGGLMGLLGFITMAAHFDTRTFPPGYLRKSIEGIVMVAIFGLLGFAFIDNGAHLGGLVGGLLLGWSIFRSRRRDNDRSQREPRLLFFGIGSLVILAGIAFIGIRKMLN